MRDAKKDLLVKIAELEASNIELEEALSNLEQQTTSLKTDNETLTDKCAEKDLIFAILECSFSKFLYFLFLMPLRPPLF